MGTKHYCDICAEESPRSLDSRWVAVVLMVQKTLPGSGHTEYRGILRAEACDKCWQRLLSTLGIDDSMPRIDDPPMSAIFDPQAIIREIAERAGWEAVIE